MRIINFEEFNLEKPLLLDSIINGAVFIYPTDTIYGVGCNAQDTKAVKKIRSLKSRATNPFSVIAPSVDWIRQNCIVTEKAENWLLKLPGPYTFIFKLKKKQSVSKEVNKGIDTLGIRIPNHWIKNIARDAGIPIVTTSVNKSNEDYMTSVEDMDDSIKGSIDFTIYEGQKEGKPSTVVDLTGTPKVMRR